MKDKLYVVCPGNYQRAVFRKLETAQALVDGLDDVDKYVNCCYEPGYHHIKIMEGGEKCD